MKKLINFYLYSSLHIGLCSAALYYFSIERLGFEVDHIYCWFILFSTILVYSLHRYVGIKKVKKFNQKGRFAIIEQYKNHILLYSMMSAGIVVYFFLQFSLSRQIALLLPGIVSILYSIPIFLKNKRLRDFSFIKIFLIAVVWALVTETIPLYEHDVKIDVLSLLFLERVLFFIGITIPFDIRDIAIDTESDVKTIPSVIGIKESRLLAILLLTISVIIEIVLIYQFDLSFIHSLPLILTYLIAIVLTKAIRSYANDYLFTGVIDGLIGLPMILYLIILMIVG